MKSYAIHNKSCVFIEPWFLAIYILIKRLSIRSSQLIGRQIVAIVFNNASYGIFLFCILEMVEDQNLFISIFFLKSSSILML